MQVSSELIPWPLYPWERTQMPTGGADLDYLEESVACGGPTVSSV
jgi:hypothetical protein